VAQGVRGATIVAYRVVPAVRRRADEADRCEEARMAEYIVRVTHRPDIEFRVETTTATEEQVRDFFTGWAHYGVILDPSIFPPGMKVRAVSQNAESEVSVHVAADERA
jgi:hypothetical protein